MIAKEICNQDKEKLLLLVYDTVQGTESTTMASYYPCSPPILYIHTMHLNARP